MLLGDGCYSNIGYCILFPFAKLSLTWRQAITEYIICKKAIKLPMMMPASSCSLSPLHYHQIAPILQHLSLPLPLLPFVKQIQVRVATSELTSRPCSKQIGPMCIIPLLYIQVLRLLPAAQLQVSLWSVYLMLTRRWKLLLVQCGHWIATFCFLTQFWWRRW